MSTSTSDPALPPGSGIERFENRKGSPCGSASPVVETEGGSSSIFGEMKRCSGAGSEPKSRENEIPISLQIFLLLRCTFRLRENVKYSKDVAVRTTEERNEKKPSSDDALSEFFGFVSNRFRRLSPQGLPRFSPLFSFLLFTSYSTLYTTALQRPHQSSSTLLTLSKTKSLPKMPGKVLFVLSSHDQMISGKPTGWYLPEAAHPFVSRTLTVPPRDAGV